MFSREIFAARIRQLRMENNLSQTEFGQLFGISKQQVSDMERGRRTTTIEQLYAIAEHFNVTSDYLIGLATLEVNSRPSEP